MVKSGTMARLLRLGVRGFFTARIRSSSDQVPETRSSSLRLPRSVNCWPGLGAPVLLSCSRFERVQRDALFENFSKVLWETWALELEKEEGPGALFGKLEEHLEGDRQQKRSGTSGELQEDRLHGLQSHGNELPLWHQQLHGLRSARNDGKELLQEGLQNLLFKCGMDLIVSGTMLCFHEQSLLYPSVAPSCCSLRREAPGVGEELSVMKEELLAYGQGDRLVTRQKEKEQLAALKKHHEEEIDHHKKEIERLQREIDRHKGKIRKLKHDD
ncbi:hypothetical protein DNTS_008405 [Danionella cerebrum]|uniref:ATP synthase F1 subunit epsilon n=1 Tax=Danionella cerebrum TaxID=2873325 RepID=A0A553MTR9_9TELE|nr:hypothetical protein DNTS_008405 [Danionella translucida]